MGNFISTTNPENVIQDVSFSLTITDDLSLFEPTSTYNLSFNGNNYSGSYISNSQIIFNNVTSNTSGYIPFTVTDS